MGVIVDLERLVAIRAELARQGASVVLTNGCFDLLHVGHVRYLQAARRLGDRLIVGINADASVRGLKGDARPLLPAAERAEVVAALGCVDYVVVFSEPTAEALIERLRPDVYVKGGDYAPGGKPLPEAASVKRHGGRVEFVPLVPDRSTSAIVEAIRDRRPLR